MMVGRGPFEVLAILILSTSWLVKASMLAVVGVESLIWEKVEAVLSEESDMFGLTSGSSGYWRLPIVYGSFYMLGVVQ